MGGSGWRQPGERGGRGKEEGMVRVGEEEGEGGGGCVRGGDSEGGGGEVGRGW